MPTLYVRDMPEDLHREIRSRAVRERRSMSAEAIKLIEEGLKRDGLRERRLQALDNIARLRATIKPSSGPDSLELLRQDRNR